MKCKCGQDGAACWGCVTQMQLQSRLDEHAATIREIAEGLGTKDPELPGYGGYVYLRDKSKGVVLSVVQQNTEIIEAALWNLIGGKPEGREPKEE